MIRLPPQLSTATVPLGIQIVSRVEKFRRRGTTLLVNHKRFWKRKEKLLLWLRFIFIEFDREGSRRRRRQRWRHSYRPKEAQVAWAGLHFFFAGSEFKTRPGATLGVASIQFMCTRSKLKVYTLSILDSRNEPKADYRGVKIVARAFSRLSRHNQSGWHRTNESK